MKIIFFEMEEWENPGTQPLVTDNEVVCLHEVLTPENAGDHADAEVISTFLSSSLHQNVLAQLPKLKFIATRSTGFDHIDLDYCKAHGIGVATVPAYGDSTVAEHAFALLLALNRHIVACAEQTRQGNFGFIPERGFELHGKTLGVIGTGRIGQRAIEIGHGFGMQVVAYDSFPRQELADKMGFRYASLEDLLAVVDVLTLHIPATPQTRGLLSDAQFDKMKTGAVLINTARGAIVDSAALIRALSSGKIGAAGLDVLPEESLVRDESQIFRIGAIPMPAVPTEVLADHVLTRFPNVLITPHNAYNTTEARQRITTTTTDNIQAFRNGKSLNRVA